MNIPSRLLRPNSETHAHPNWAFFATMGIEFLSIKRWFLNNWIALLHLFMLSNDSYRYLSEIIQLILLLHIFLSVFFFFVFFHAFHEHWHCYYIYGEMALKKMFLRYIHVFQIGCEPFLGHSSLKTKCKALWITRTHPDE